METEYNLAINELKRKKMSLEKEVSSLIIERDKIYNEIRDQRNGNTIISQEISNKENVKYFILEQLEIINKTLAQNRQNFVHITQKETNYLKILENSIREKQEMESNFKIKQEELEKIEDLLKTKNKEFKKVSLEIGNLQQAINIQNTELKANKVKFLEKETKLLGKEQYLNDKQISLDNKEKELNILAKRLEKLKLSLKR